MHKISSTCRLLASHYMSKPLYNSSVRGGSSILQYRQSRNILHFRRSSSNSSDKPPPPPPPPSSETRTGASLASGNAPPVVTSSSSDEPPKERPKRPMTSTERNFITPVRAMQDFLLKTNDLSGLRKTMRRSPHADEPPISVYWKRDVEQRWGLFLFLLSHPIFFPWSNNFYMFPLNVGLLKFGVVGMNLKRKNGDAVKRTRNTWMVFMQS